jgi:hypothetical protein
LVKAIAWPVAIFATAFLFRLEVRALFPRLTKAGPTGLEFDLARQTITTSTELRELPGPQPTPAIAKVQASIQEELKVVDSDHRMDLLVRHLAVARLAWTFEQMHRILYGSQIRALVALSNVETGKATRAEAENAFHQTRRLFPNSMTKTHLKSGSDIQKTWA